MRWTNCMRWNSFHHLRWEWPILARRWPLPHAPPNPVRHLAPAWGPGTRSLSDDICINPRVWCPDSLPARVCSFSGGFIFSSLSRSLLEESRCTTARSAMGLPRAAGRLGTGARADAKTFIHSWSEGESTLMAKPAQPEVEIVSRWDQSSAKNWSALCSVGKVTCAVPYPYCAMCVVKHFLLYPCNPHILQKKGILFRMNVRGFFWNPTNLVKKVVYNKLVVACWRWANWVILFPFSQWISNGQFLANTS